MPPEAAAPAAAPASAPAPAAAAPAGAPAAGDGGAPAAPAAAPAAAPKPEGNIVADAGAPAAPAAVSLDDAKAYLTAKGVKPDELAKLDEAGIRAKHEELKAAEGKAAAKIDPKSIELKMPEGFTMEEAELTGFREILADANLSAQDRGQRLLDLHVAAMKAAVDEPMKLWNKMQAEWQAEVKADKDLGGQNWPATQAAIAKALDAGAGKKGTPAGDAVREAFNLTGAGNNPAIVRMLVGLAKFVTEGSPAPGNPPSPGNTDQQVLATMYPSAQPKA